MFKVFNNFHLDISLFPIEKKTQFYVEMAALDGESVKRVQIVTLRSSQNSILLILIAPLRKINLKSNTLNGIGKKTHKRTQ